MMTTKSAYSHPLGGNAAEQAPIIDLDPEPKDQAPAPAIPASRPKPAVPMTASEAVSTILLLRDRFVANSQPYDLADGVLTYLLATAENSKPATEAKPKGKR